MAAGPLKRGPVRRGQVYLVRFDPTRGSEIRKTRPAVVVQNDIANTYSPITIVAAVTSRIDDEIYETEVAVRAGEGGLAADSLVLLNQLRSIDTETRIVKLLGRLSAATMSRVDRVLRLSLGLVEI